MPDIEKMATESLYYSALGLSNILFFASSISLGIDHVGAFAAYVVFAGYFFPVVLHFSVSILLRRAPLLVF